MNELMKFGSTSGVAGSAYVAGALQALPSVIPAAAVMTAGHIAPSAHAVLAAAAAAQPRKRRAAAASDPSVDRGFI